VDEIGPSRREPLDRTSGVTRPRRRAGLRHRPRAPRIRWNMYLDRRQGTLHALRFGRLEVSRALQRGVTRADRAVIPRPLSVGCKARECSPGALQPDFPGHVGYDLREDAEVRGIAQHADLVTQRRPCTVDTCRQAQLRRTGPYQSSSFVWA